jgi:hypothetical protein
MKYTIYHIPGVKIGVSSVLKRRIREQGFNQYEILEKHNDIHIASKREKELQKQFGYPIDITSYEDILKISSHNSRGKGNNICKLKMSIPILCFDYKTNKFLKEYTGTREACRQLSLNLGNVNSVLKNKLSQTKGYYFKYKDLEINKK